MTELDLFLFKFTRVELFLFVFAIGMAIPILVTFPRIFVWVLPVAIISLTIFSCVARYLL